MAGINACEGLPNTTHTQKEDTKGKVMQIGEIRYRVYIDSGEPWVCRCKAIKISPTGRVRTFKAIDCKSKEVFKENTQRDAYVAKTKIGSLRQFQRMIMKAYQYTFSYNVAENDVDKDILYITKAQKLIDEMTFCPTI